MRHKSLEVAAWCGPLGLILFGIGIGPLLANMLPPPSPAAGPSEIAELYRSNLAGIRAGAIFLIMSGAVIVVFMGGVAAQMRRMEGDLPVLSYVTLAGGALSTTPFFLGALIMGVASFRPERSPEIIQLINDFAWIYYVMPAGNALVQTLPLGFLIIGDRSAEPVFPRWIGYFSIWVGISFLPPSFLLFFKHGPFAWNGLLSFWLGAVTLTLWAFVICWALIRISKYGRVAKQ